MDIPVKDLDLILSVQVLYRLSVLKEYITCSFNVIYVFSSVTGFATAVASSVCMFMYLCCNGQLRRLLNEIKNRQICDNRQSKCRYLNYEVHLLYS
jgi:hypothetical protein